MVDGAVNTGQTNFLTWIHELREGALFRSIHTGELERLRIVRSPRLRLPSGELVFEDIDYLQELDPFGDCRVALPTGDSSIVLGAFAVPDRSTRSYSPVVCIVGNLERAVNWQLVGRVVSDHGAVCAYDASARRVFRARVESEAEYFAIHDELVDTSTFVPVEDGELTLVVFHCGMGSGAYPVWRGVDGDGNPVCAVADLATLDHYESLHQVELL